MLRILAPFAIAMILTACGQANDSEGPATSQVVAPPPAENTMQLTGKQAYEQACAQCHDEGVDGAPKTGDREAWAGRSWLWEAVLFEHAKDGFMAMPAQGGEAALDDAIVEMAAEYMLAQTYPDVMPSD